MPLQKLFKMENLEIALLNSLCIVRFHNDQYPLIKFYLPHQKNRDFLIIKSLKNDTLTGTYRISGIGSTTFSFSIATSPKKVDFTADEGQFSYVTSSRTAFGPIANVVLNNSMHLKLLLKP